MASCEQLLQVSDFGMLAMVGNTVARLLSPKRVDIASREVASMSGKTVLAVARTRTQIVVGSTTAVAVPDEDAAVLRLEADPQNTPPPPLQQPYAAAGAAAVWPAGNLAGVASLKVRDATAGNDLSFLEISPQHVVSRRYWAFRTLKAPRRAPGR